MPNDSRDTIDIDGDFAASGESVVLDMEDDDVLGIYIRGDGAVDYEIDVSNKPASANDWFEAAETLTGATDYNDGFFEAARYVRVKVASGSGTGGSGDTADVLLTSGGGEN